jgi:hypothetical protein
MKTIVHCGVLFLTFFAAGSLWAQTDQTADYDLNALRADLKADKADIINQAMQLSPDDSKKFWPVYKQYDQELSSINDNLVQLVKTYADKFGSINDSDAKDLTTKALDVQAKKIALKQKYFPIFAKATSPLTAAKFYQVEYRLELLFNVKLASELPALLIQPAPAPSAGAKAN